jgi:hypothetical protein
MAPGTTTVPLCGRRHDMTDNRLWARTKAAVFERSYFFYLNKDARHMADSLCR